MTFELLSRPGCHLCDEMAAELDAVLPAHGFTYKVVDVDSDPALRARFGGEIPVLLRDGKTVAKVRLRPGQLARIVERRRVWPSLRG